MIWGGGEKKSLTKETFCSFKVLLEREKREGEKEREQSFLVVFIPIYFWLNKYVFLGFQVRCGARKVTVKNGSSLWEVYRLVYRKGVLPWMSIGSTLPWASSFLWIYLFIYFASHQLMPDPWSWFDSDWWEEATTAPTSSCTRSSDQGSNETDQPLSLACQFQGALGKPWLERGWEPTASPLPTEPALFLSSSPPPCTSMLLERSSVNTV